MRHITYLLFTFVCGAMFTGCGDSTAKEEALREEREALAGVDSRSASNDASSKPRKAALEFEAQPGWTEEQPSSAMRRAQFRLPAAEGDDESPAVVVFYMGGSVQDNLRRWIGQFELDEGAGNPLEDNVSVQTRDGMRMHTLDITGKLLSDSMGQSVNKDGQRMLSTVIESTDGSFPNDGKYFVRLIGPEKTIAKWENSYMDLLNSL